MKDFRVIEFINMIGIFDYKEFMVVYLVGKMYCKIYYNYVLSFIFWVNESFMICYYILWIVKYLKFLF